MAPSPIPSHLLMNATAIRRVLSRMACEISHEHAAPGLVVLVGIQTGGVRVAQALARNLEKIWGHPVHVGQLDVTMHRDDLHHRMAPKVHPTSIPFDITGKVVVLVDDVLFSGRTTRAALDALHDLGRPKRTQLAVLIDRGHRELPIKADFVGKSVRTALTDRIEVVLAETNGVAKVLLEKAAAK